jgi:hypothetical protein
MAIKSFRSRSFAFISSAIFVIASSGKAFPQDSKDYWSEFRQQYPFHFQELLISNPDISGQRSLIISEPPPGFLPSNAEQILKDCFGTVYGGFKAKQHPLGFNGWVRDYVVTLTSPTGETQEEINRQVDDGIAALSYSLYGTTYKAHALQLPIKQPQKFDEAPPSLSISPGELKTWLTDSNRAFVSVDTSQPTTLKSILDSKFTGVFLSQKPGLALLVLHRSEDLAKHWSDLRKFALDSDLILGGIVQKNDDALVIVGRERQTNLSAMPPLRAETILTLAATTNNELWQSINIGGSLSGKIEEGEFKGKDWGPNELSKNLINTELGSLLTMTDYLVKSWSEAGNFKIDNFPYPKPQFFPFGGKSLYEQIGASTLIYNWNTKGLGAIYDFGNYELFTVTRTGSLPVSYIPEQKKSELITGNSLVKFEEEGYSYFSQQQNVHLSQVVSYTALYQIFRSFPFKNTTWKNQVNSQYVHQIDREIFVNTLSALKQIQTDNYNRKIQKLEASGDEIDTKLAKKLNYIRSLATKDLEGFANSLINYEVKEDPNIIRELNYFLGNVLGKSTVLKHIVDVSSYEPDSNIKTPTVVVSKYIGKNIIGGHNLDSTVTKFILDSKQSRGTVNINKSTGELRIHPDDAINSKSVARFYSRNKTQFDLQKQFQIPPASKVSPQSISNLLSPKRVDNIPGLSLRSEVPDIAKNNVGFQSESIPIGEDGMRQITELAQGRNLDLYVEQLQDGFAIYRGHPPGFIHASSPSALLEILSSSGSMWTKKSGHIYFNNFSEGSIEGIKQSLTVRTQSNDGGLLSQLLPSRKPFFSKNNDSRRWNFDLVPQEQGDFEVLKVSRKQEDERSRNIFSKIRLNEKPDWSKATITRLENLPSSITQSQKPGLIGMSYQVTLPVSNKKPIDLLVNPFLKRSWTPEDISLGETTIQNSFKSSAANNATLEQGLVNLKKELQERLTTTDLEFFYKEGLDGMIIIRKDSEDNAS